jgi:ribulose 1,5-bisphosphate carboxylase large subunit-like protein
MGEDRVQDTAGSAGGDYKKDAKINMNDFQRLLNRLERSKKRQVRQKSVEGRRDIYAQGLAGMMSNF